MNSVETPVFELINLIKNKIPRDTNNKFLPFNGDFRTLLQLSPQYSWDEDKKGTFFAIIDDILIAAPFNGIKNNRHQGLAMFSYLGSLIIGDPLCQYPDTCDMLKEKIYVNKFN